MADWLLDPITHDLVVTDDVSFTSGIGIIAQAIDLRMNAFKGEWFANLERGFLEIDTVGALGASDTTLVLGGKYSQAGVTSAARKLLIDTPGVDQVISLTVSFDGGTRSVSITWRVRAGQEYIDGEFDI